MFTPCFSLLLNNKKGNLDFSTSSAAASASVLFCRLVECREERIRHDEVNAIKSGPEGVGAVNVLESVAWVGADSG